jgi:predicted ATPase
MQPPPFLTGFRLDREAVRSFKEYPFSLPAIRKMKRVKLHPAVTFFVGENGSGKSTLIEALAVANKFNAEGGSKNFDFSTRASHSCLHNYLILEKPPGRWVREGYFLRAESFFNVATEIERLDNLEGAEKVRKIGGSYYGDRPLHEQSHGESFFALLTNRLYGDGLYIRRAGGCAVALAADEHAGADSRPGAERRAIHHRHALAHPAGLPRCDHLRDVRRRHARRALPGDGKLSRHARLPQPPGENARPALR